MWYITGDETYRSNAMRSSEIIPPYRSVVTHTNFRFATMTYLLAAAAEILRYSDTPTAESEMDGCGYGESYQYDEPCITVTYNAHTFFMNQHQFAVDGNDGKSHLYQ